MSQKTSMLGSMLALLRRRVAGDEKGATAIEYAMIAAGVGAAVATTVYSVSSSLKTNFYDRLASMF
jgi:pilus assembly protein Flp/PilA